MDEKNRARSFVGYFRSLAKNAVVVYTWRIDLPLPKCFFFEWQFRSELLRALTRLDRLPPSENRILNRGLC